MLNKFYTQKWEIILTCLLILSIFVFKIGSIFCFYILPDEFTYWSYAARFAGKDWSEITALGPYFSFGYSFLLFPIFALFKDAVMAYRVAICLNFFLLIFSYWLLTKLGGRLIPDSCNSLLFATIVILFPSYIFYSQTTLTEIAILFFYLLSCYLLYQYYLNNRVVTLILLMLSLMYLYVVHMRTIGILISFIFVLIIHLIRDRKKKTSHLFICLGMTLILFVAGNIMKEWAYVEVYGGINPELVSTNDYLGQIDKLRYIVTPTGLYDLIISLGGKVLYLGMASYGTFYFGVYGLLKKIKNEKSYFALFILLTIVIQICISTVYLLTLGEIADYTYGRYNEFILPVVMFLGINELYQFIKQKKWRIFVFTISFILIYHAVTTLLVVRQTIMTHAEGYQGYFICGISYLYSEENFTVESFYFKAYIFSIVLMMLCIIILFLSAFSTVNAISKGAIWGFALVEILLSFRLNAIFTNPYRVSIFRDISISEIVSEIASDDRQVYYFDSEVPASIGIIQFSQRDLKVNVIRSSNSSFSTFEDVIDSDDILLFDFQDSRYELWMDMYQNFDKYGHMAILYNN